MNPSSPLAQLEALLFIHGEPMAVKKIAQILGTEPDAVGTLLGEFETELRAAGRGLALVRDGDKVQLVTKPEFHSLLEGFVKDELKEDLTPAALETLAIVSYFGPVSRARIEYQRGVNSIFILRNLLLRGLIERYPDPERTNSYLYRPSFELLKHLGVSRQEDLPEQDKFKTMLAQFETNPGT